MDWACFFMSNEFGIMRNSVWRSIYDGFGGLGTNSTGPFFKCQLRGASLYFLKFFGVDLGLILRFTDDSEGSGSLGMVC